MMDNTSLVYQDPKTGDTWTLQTASLENDFQQMVALIFAEDTTGLLPNIQSLHETYTILSKAGELDLLLLLKNNIPITLLEIQYSNFPIEVVHHASSGMLQLFYHPEHNPSSNPIPYAETLNFLLRHFHTLYLSIEIYNDELIYLANQLGLTHYVTTDILSIPKTIYQISRNNSTSAI